MYEFYLNSTRERYDPPVEKILKVAVVGSEAFLTFEHLLHKSQVQQHIEVDSMTVDVFELWKGLTVALDGNQLRAFAARLSEIAEGSGDSPNS